MQKLGLTHKNSATMSEGNALPEKEDKLTATHWVGMQQLDDKNILEQTVTLEQNEAQRRLVECVYNQLPVSELGVNQLKSQPQHVLLLPINRNYSSSKIIKKDEEQWIIMGPMTLPKWGSPQNSIDQRMT